jgi:diguanylate cyclase (GGDEF)-like protein
MIMVKPNSVSSFSNWSRVNKRLLILFIVYGLFASLTGALLLIWADNLRRNEDSRFQAHSLQSFVSTLLNNQSSYEASEQLLLSYRSDLSSQKEYDQWISSFIVLDDKAKAVYASQRSWLGQDLATISKYQKGRDKSYLSLLSECFRIDDHPLQHKSVQYDSNGGSDECFDRYNRQFSLNSYRSFLVHPISVHSRDVGLLNKRFFLVVGFDKSYFSSETLFIILNSFATSAGIVAVSLAILYGLIRLRFLADIKSAAEEDYLTSLPNRSSFTESSVNQLASAEAANSSCILAIVDIDLFKNINDTYGHQCGDYVLSEVARLIDSSLRPSDLVGRLGGEEFAILIECPRPEAVKVLDRIRLQIEFKKYAYEGRSLSVTVSMGAAESEEFGYNFDFLYSQADKALYHAKEEGRNCVRWARKLTKREGWDPGSAWDRSFGMDDR